jgi:hypothetical protein
MKRRLHLLSLLAALIVALTSCDWIYDDSACAATDTGDWRCKLVIHSSGNMTADSIYLNYNTRSDTTQYDLNLVKRYIVKIYEPGNHSKPLYDFVFYSTDFLTSDEDIEDLDIPYSAKGYDVWIWSDFVNAEKRTNLYYDADNFADIHLLDVKRQGTYASSCFAGFVDINFNQRTDNATIDVYLGRPVGSFTIIAENLSDIVRELAPGTSLSDYHILTTFPLYLPSQLDLFTGNIVGTRSDVSFESEITAFGDNDEAVLSFAYVLLGSSTAGGVDITLTLVGPDGTKWPLTGVLNVPMRRDQNTYVFGRFSKPTPGGIGINYNFSGEYVIYI